MWSGVVIMWILGSTLHIEVADFNIVVCWSHLPMPLALLIYRAKKHPAKHQPWQITLSFVLWILYLAAKTSQQMANEAFFRRAIEDEMRCVGAAEAEETRERAYLSERLSNRIKTKKTFCHLHRSVEQKCRHLLAWFIRLAFRTRVREREGRPPRRDYFFSG